MSNQEIIADIVKRDSDPPLYKRAYLKWLQSLTASELAEYYELVKADHPDNKQQSLPA